MEQITTPSKPKMRTQMREMLPAQSLHFPIEMLVSVRNAASELGAMMKRKYTTSVDRPNEVIWVTRVL